MESGTFKPVHIKEVPAGTRVFGNRSVNELKQLYEGTIHESRLVAQNLRDVQATRMATKSPAVQWPSQRLVFSLAASTPGTRSF